MTTNDYNGRWRENRQLIMLLERGKERAWRSMDEYDAACERERTRLRTVRTRARAAIGERKSFLAEAAGFYSRLQPALFSIILIVTVYAFMTSLRPHGTTQYTVHVPVVIAAATNDAVTTNTDYTLILFAAVVAAAAAAWHQRKRLCLNVCARRLGQLLRRRSVA